MAATSAAPAPPAADGCRKSSSEATMPLLPAARGTRPHRRTLYDALMQTRLLAIFAALVATIALIAGCSSKSQDPAKALPDAATLLKQSSDTTKSQSSVHLKLAVQGTIKDLPI